jgi:hypothetical protein
MDQKSEHVAKDFQVMSVENYLMFVIVFQILNQIYL